MRNLESISTVHLKKLCDEPSAGQLSKRFKFRSIKLETSKSYTTDLHAVWRKLKDIGVVIEEEYIAYEMLTHLPSFLTTRKVKFSISGECKPASEFSPYPEGQEENLEFCNKKLTHPGFKCFKKLRTSGIESTFQDSCQTFKFREKKFDETADICCMTEASLLMCTTSLKSDEWYPDTCASCHITCHARLLFNQRPNRWIFPWGTGT